jgi:hypothetical protein
MLLFRSPVQSCSLSPDKALILIPVPAPGRVFLIYFLCFFPALTSFSLPVPDPPFFLVPVAAPDIVTFPAFLPVLTPISFSDPVFVIPKAIPLFLFRYCFVFVPVSYPRSPFYTHS